MSPEAGSESASMFIDLSSSLSTPACPTSAPCWANLGPRSGGSVIPGRLMCGPGGGFPLKTWVCGAKPLQRAFRGWEEVFVLTGHKTQESCPYAAWGHNALALSALQKLTKLFLQTERDGERAKIRKFKNKMN